jgi:hypothetical protein
MLILVIHRCLRGINRNPESFLCSSLANRPSVWYDGKKEYLPQGLVMSETIVVGAKKRGRQAIEVTPAELQEQINKLESNTPDGNHFPNRSALWSALEATEWAKTRRPRPLSGQVAMVLANKFKLTIKTPLGKRGGGSVPINTGSKTRRVISLDVLTPVKKVVPQKYQKLVNSMAKGSKKAAIKLVCLQCSNWQPNEVRHCPVTNCVTYPIRPFQGKPKEGE